MPGPALGESRWVRSNHDDGEVSPGRWWDVGHRTAEFLGENSVVASVLSYRFGCHVYSGL
jgi:hypothetical protein